MASQRSARWVVTMPPSPAVVRILSWQKLQAARSAKLPTDWPWMRAPWAWAQSSTTGMALVRGVISGAIVAALIGSALFGSALNWGQPARFTDKLWLFRGVAMKVKVQTWGNSLGLRIPKAYATELGVRPGSEMELNLEAGTLLARPAAAVDLNALLAEITAENQHAECGWGAAIGAEAW
jgi:antitoxin MazE